MHLVLILALFALDEGAEKKEPPAGPQPPKLVFEDDESRASFEEAFRLFIEARWDAATAAFKVARKGVAKESKNELRGFEDACKGGPKLDGVAEEIGKGKPQRAYKKLLDLEAKYSDGPLRYHLDPYFESLDAMLFEVLANYEPAPAKAEESDKDKARKAREEYLKGMLGRGDTEVVDDPAFVRRGKQALRWKGKGGASDMGFARIGAGGAVLARFEGPILAEHQYLHISLHPGTANDCLVRLSFVDSPDSSVVVTNYRDNKSERLKIHDVTLRPQVWNDLRIDLWSADIRERVSFDDVYGIRLELLQPRETREIYIDEVKLEKR